MVHEDGEEGLSAAGILNHLRREEVGFSGIVVKGAIERFGRVGLRRGRRAGWVLEEENDAVDGAVSQAIVSASRSLRREDLGD